MGKHILILEPISSGEGLPKAAKELGCYVTAIALNSGFVKLNEECLKNIDNLIEMNVSMEDLVEKKVHELNSIRPIDAIISGFEFFVPLANKLASKLGLACNDINWVDATRYKHLMAKNFTEYNIPAPKTFIAKSVDEAKLAVEQLGFPCIVKPSDSLGSCDVYKVQNLEELEQKFKIIANRPDEEDWKFPMISLVLIQEFVDGEEVSVETLVSEGEVKFLNITDKLVTNGPCFVELGHLIPSRKDSKVIEKIKETALSVHKSLGIKYGITHVEMRLNNGSPIVIEIAARLPGDRIPYVIKYGVGVDLWKYTIQSYLRQPFKIEQKHKKGACIRFLTTNLKGKFKISGSSNLEGKPEIMEYKINTDLINSSGEIQNFLDRYGHVITVGETADSALKNAEEYLKMLSWISLKDIDESEVS